MSELVTDGGAGSDSGVEEQGGRYKAMDPFLDEQGRGRSKTFEVNKPVNFLQLQDEIKEAVGVEEGAEFLFATSLPDWRSEASPENPLTVYVAPGDSLDGRTVRSVLDRHTADPEYGVTEPEPEPGPAPSESVVLPEDADDETKDVVRKIKNDETVTVKEVARVLKAILRDRD